MKGAEGLKLSLKAAVKIRRFVLCMQLRLISVDLSLLIFLNVLISELHICIFSSSPHCFFPPLTSPSSLSALSEDLICSFGIYLWPLNENRKSWAAVLQVSLVLCRGLVCVVSGQIVKGSAKDRSFDHSRFKFN